MIVIRTGKPGNGKTLNTIKEVDLQASQQDRVVYYHNVNGLKPERLRAQWFKFDDPLKWYELPKDSIIVVDEAQGNTEQPMFGIRDPRASVPLHVSKFETLRHEGLEVHLITQDPRFIDVHIRRLCNRHVHYWRVFQSAKVARFESDTVIADVEKKAAFKDADKTIIKLDRRLFDVYASSNASHHFKLRVPKKFLLAGAFIVGVGIFVFNIASDFLGKDAVAETSAPSGEDAGIVAQVASAANTALGSDGEKKVKTALAYQQERTARVPGVPATAPLYDELTKPKTYPKLYCMSSHDPHIYANQAHRMASGAVNGRPTVCQCYSQQGTRIQTAFSFCMNVVDYGYFDPAIPDRGKRQAGDSDSNDYEPRPMPSVSAESHPPGSAPVVVSYDKDKFLW